MAKIANTQRLTVEQFPDQKEWIAPLFSVVNDFFQKVQSTINGSIEFKSNVMGAEFTFDFIYVSHAVSLPLEYKWTMVQKPKSAYVASAYLGNSTGQGGTVISNKTLVPFICQVAWEYTQDGSVRLSDFCWISGSGATVATPISGQRVVITLRVEP